MSRFDREQQGVAVAGVGVVIIVLAALPLMMAVMMQSTLASQILSGIVSLGAGLVVLGFLKFEWG